MSVPGHIVCFFIVSSCFYCAKFDSEAGYLGFFLGGSSAGGSSALATPAIDSFSFLAADNASLTTDVTGTINGTTITLAPPLSVDLTALVATFSTTGATEVSESGTTQTSGTSALDYTSSRTFQLSAGDGTTASYTVQIDLDATDGLILYLPFSGDAQDAVGTNHGTVTGPTLTSDRQGNVNSAYLYGASGEITLAAGPAVSSTGSWTFALWVRPDVFGADTANSGAGNGDFILDRTPENNPLVNFKISNGQLYVGQVRSDAGTGLAQIVGTAATAGSWAHLVLVREAGVDFRLYVDGAQVGNLGSDGLGALTPDAFFSNQFVTGVIDEFRVYDRMLGDQEISNLASHVD